MSKWLRMCLNWKVLAGLGVVALGIGVLAPGAFGRALPLLLLAACPLSMMAMMGSMSRGGHGAPPANVVPEVEDLTTLRTRQAALAAEQEQVSERLARLAPQASGDRAEKPTNSAGHEADIEESVGGRGQ
ncbi:MAG: DUF2933 domain-containing protein [Acidimicrobiia bacterium]